MVEGCSVNFLTYKISYMKGEWRMKQYLEIESVFAREILDSRGNPQ